MAGIMVFSCKGILMVSNYLLLFIEKNFLTIRDLREDVGPAVADELFDSVSSAAAEPLGDQGVGGGV